MSFAHSTVKGENGGAHGAKLALEEPKMMDTEWGLPCPSKPLTKVVSTAPSSASAAEIIDGGGEGDGDNAIWLPWSRPSCSKGSSISAQCKAVCDGYSSPLEPVPSACVAAAAYGYGNGGSMSAGGGQGVSVPLAAFLHTPSDTGFTLSVAPPQT